MDISENPIGVGGASALMSVNLIEGHRLTIDIKGCSLKNVDPTCWFDAANVKTKDFSLKLDSPYERAVCIELLRLAGGSDEYKVDKLVVLESESDSNGREITLGSHSTRTTSFDAVLSDQDNSHHTNATNNGTNHTASTHLRQIYAQMFERYDTNNSGGLDWKEMLVVLDELGMESSLEIIQKLLLVYDADGSGIIELDEVRIRIPIYHYYNYHYLRTKLHIPVDKNNICNYYYYCYY